MDRDRERAHKILKAGIEARKKRNGDDLTPLAFEHLEKYIKKLEDMLAEKTEK